VIVVWEDPDDRLVILAGNGRTREAAELGYTELPCDVLYGWSEAEARDYALRDNATGLLGKWDVAELTRQLGTTTRAVELGFDMPSLAALSVTLDAPKLELRPPTTVKPDPASDKPDPASDKPDPKNRYADGRAGALTDVFGTPPFTVLDANRGTWRKRKALWAEMLERGEGRDTDLLIDGGGQALADAKTGALTRTSVFDPVLAELLVRWFSAPGAAVLDPFAGGAERGLVAATLGRTYTGIEIRPDQVDANREQAAGLGISDAVATWVKGEAAKVLRTWEAGPRYDLVLGCPPYYDLEIYSEIDGDLSAAPSYEDFLSGYTDVVAQTCARLRDDRFAAWVVGDIRDARGMLRGFVGDTIAAFRAAGLELYNEGVLVTLAGTLPLRAGQYMRTSRKLGRNHQSVLVFCKGDPKAATDWCGELSPVALGGDGATPPP